MKYWNTDTKRWSVAIAMGIVAYSALTQSMPTWPAIPSQIANPFMGSFSIITIAAIYTLFGIYLLIDNQLNG